MHFLVLLSSLFLLLPFDSPAQEKINTEVLVVGAGTGGTAAGIQAARSGAKTILVDPINWLGGMLTAAGVSCTDGNNALHAGIWESFRQALYEHYQTKILSTGWVSETCFEPHVGDSIFKAWASREKNLTVMYNWQFEKITSEKNRVTGAIFKDKGGRTLIITAKITIDATELGDVLADAGVAFDIGTEDKRYSGEKMAPGKTNIIQDLTWVAILKDYGPGADKTIVPPSGYNPEVYHCCCSSAPCSGIAYKTDARGMLNYGRLPGNKYMINWPAHGNDSYINAIADNYTTRDRKYESAREHTLGFVYFIQTVLGFKNLGLADDELDSGLALIPYNREGRRMRGLVRMNVNDILDPYGRRESLYRTGIAVGDYPVDHHHGQNPSTPEIIFPPIPSFNIPLGVLIPAHTDGLIACEKGISVSNIVNGATRLQPVVLLTGQAAGILAAWSATNKKPPRAADTRSIQQQLLNNKCYLMPFADVPPEDPCWEAVQRIGATGILKGRGKAEGWANKTFFDPDSTLHVHDLVSGLNRCTPYQHDIQQLFPAGSGENKTLRYKDLEYILWRLKDHILKGKYYDAHAWASELHLFILSNFGYNPDPGRAPTKKEIAAVIDQYLDPFSTIKIDLFGKME